MCLPLEHSMFLHVLEVKIVVLSKHVSVPKTYEKSMNILGYV